jgi:hypothetical protein
MPGREELFAREEKRGKGKEGMKAKAYVVVVAGNVGRADLEGVDADLDCSSGSMYDLPEG